MVKQMTSGSENTLPDSWFTGGSIPAGLICMWSGLLANIPSGWVLCDGLNGTPDLRSVFVKGAAAGANPGATGGAATHSHAQHVSQGGHQHDNLGAHTHDNHGMSQPTIAWPAGVPTQVAHAHDAHTISTKFTTSGSGTAADTAPVTHAAATPVISWPVGVPTNSGGGVTPITHASGGGHLHASGGTHQHDAHDSPNSEPAYFALAFIMKTA